MTDRPDNIALAKKWAARFGAQLDELPGRELLAVLAEHFKHQQPFEYRYAICRRDNRYETHAGPDHRCPRVGDCLCRAES